MSYAVKEMFYTLQGEGAQAGRASLFCRFAGCNLWSGREEDRHKAVCQFCDTDFVGMDGPGGGRFASPEALATRARQMWDKTATANSGKPYIVCTGGEPLLQLDPPLIDALHKAGFEIAVETNGTIEAPDGIDWICVSPKAGSELVQTAGNELKLVWPQPPFSLEQFESLGFDRFYLQPMDGPDVLANTRLCVETAMARPSWRLSLQTHKIIGIA
ncbi:7-carboxy-7-deazaguanine synthase [Notoacmeibacter sp. MSK16QG-6]|uniref:7-carboxy-7-deazaguanine synthase n=1 Tax=Notoacmeibacter sp. MSK16QG-6 TaxID=2957982 RepID=UPI00209DD6F6|nr:7-carboxy-7-deazaguanine synthase [Notoacmeibacter sp. MSK16QG-6]MCP1200426.1 7-carboxy-7-deazaguanine synthase [Notoacmeibacter sp. MSK16QG-6]